MYIDLEQLIRRLEPLEKCNKTLGIIKCGEHRDSTSYIKSIEKKAKELDIKTILVDLENTEKVYKKIMEIQGLSNAILPIKPFPELIEKFLELNILNFKDIDNFSGESIFENCTAEGILEILKFLGIGIDKHVLVVGRGVGREMGKMLLKNDYTVMVAHSKTRNLELLTRNADVIISATGVKNLIKKDMVKINATVIDVGLGDVDPNVIGKAYVTQIKNGVGAVTTQILFKHLLEQ